MRRREAVKEYGFVVPQVGKKGRREGSSKQKAVGFRAKGSPAAKVEEEEEEEEEGARLSCYMFHLTELEEEWIESDVDENVDDAQAEENRS